MTWLLTSNNCLDDWLCWLYLQITESHNPRLLAVILTTVATVAMATGVMDTVTMDAIAKTTVPMEIFMMHQNEE